ncbi:MAG: lysophospholipid acyltransferase family protein [Candidatus Cloacimonetes bacterium]|nr:lysophospholipid acyltransferase family protein [Candidatus Cloacimonadota bacterium]
MQDKWWFSSYSCLAAALLKLLKKTLRVEAFNQPQTEPVVYAFWHRNLMYSALLRAGDKIAVMASVSKDGELISGPLEKLGYRVVRGSSSKRGSEALKELVDLADSYSLGITPDGPRGPLGKVHKGVFALALLTGLPLIAVHIDAQSEWVFNSWDRFRFPKPFTKVRAFYSDPIYVKTREDIPLAIEQYRSFLEQKEKENLWP